MIISNRQLDSILPEVTRPARYTGGEWNSVIKDWEVTPLRIALAYPDLYEIGASNLAIPILYEIVNARSDALAERVYAPWPDMAAAMRKAGIPLYSLETKHAIADFDIFGFSLEHELTYTNVLEMLDLAAIPVLAADRDDSHPIIIAGGTCCLNPEPMADFIDLFCLGEGEELMAELVQLLAEWKDNQASSRIRSPRGKSRRRERLRRAAALEGVYVPSLYKVDYDDGGLVATVSPVAPHEAGPVIRRRIVRTLPPPVTRPVVPFIEVVQDRAAIEIQRGCTRGCRFCQAGIVYRPLRERPVEEVVKATGELLKTTGYRELSLVSLSTADYSGIDKLVAALMDNYQKDKLMISLPSLRIDNFSLKLMEALPQRKKLAFTFAPEAGSERLRCAINKVIKDEQIMEVAQAAFDRGWNSLKLYFLLGLPTETEEDLLAITSLVRNIISLRGKANGHRPQIKASLSSFVPKPHTPFQWAAQDSLEELLRKQDLVRRGLRKIGAQLSWSSPPASVLEAAFSRGDRRLGKVVHAAWRKGCVFDAWSERFDYQKWLAAFQECGLEIEFFARRERGKEEVLPWGHISTGVTANYLWREYDCTLKGKEILDCRYGRCHACGLEKWLPQCEERVRKLDG
ncbi:MAG: TIGR03960 family B12-binding radical SAM protein [Chloroflexi bacterium]|nr:TIGR03960 family B12-binding radical SAM protein [Chloroflexota bacterium]